MNQTQLHLSQNSGVAKGGPRPLNHSHKTYHRFKAPLNLPVWSVYSQKKIIKIVATRSYLLKLKCTKFNFGYGSAPDPTGGANSAPSDLIAGF